jgi:hypothetical protein
MKLNAFIAIPVLTVLIGKLVTTGLSAQNWPMINANKERTSWARGETGLLPPLIKSKEFILDGRYASRMSFFDNMLYVSVTADTNKVLAFRAGDGSIAWRFDITFRRPELPSDLCRPFTIPCCSVADSMLRACMPWTGLREGNTGLKE